MNNLLVLFVVFAVAILFFLVIRRLSHNGEVTLYEITYRMLPVIRDLLGEIAEKSPNWRNQSRRDYSLRREIRNALDDLKEQFYRICANATKVKDCASYYLSLYKKYPEQLEEQDPAKQDEEREIAALHRVLETERELRSVLRHALMVIWFWDMTAFHKRQRGPVPDVAKLRIREILEAYEKVKLAAVHLARCYGEAAIGEDLMEAM